MNPVLSFLLVMIIVLCPLSSEAQEYYVTPSTPPQNPSGCPSDKPCHTLSYYVTNAPSLLDSRENVSLLFLDGFHDSAEISIRQVRTLTIARVSNLNTSIYTRVLIRAALHIQSVSMLSLKSVSFESAELKLINVNWFSSQQAVFENSTIFALPIRSGVLISNSVFMFSSFEFNFELVCNRSDCSRNATGIEQHTIVLRESVFDGPGNYTFILKHSPILPAPVTSNCNISFYDILITGSEIMDIRIEQQYTALFVDVNNCSIQDSKFGLKMVKAAKVDVFVTIANSHFSHNVLALFVMSNTDSLGTSLLDLTVLHTTFFRNNACGSILLDVNDINQSLLLENVSIVHSQGNRPDLKSMGASLTVYGPGTISVKDCIFESNVGVSAFAVINVDLFFTGYNQFVGNVGIDGGALILINTTMWLDNGTHISFINNRARAVGGAIWIKEDNTRQPIFFNIRTNHYSNCFYQLAFDLQEPWENQLIPISITFENNSAFAGGDNIFGGGLQSNCKMTPNKQISSFEIARNIFTMKSSLSSVSSSPKRVCLCENEIPVCVRRDLHQVSVTSGERFNLSLAVVGDDFGVVTGSVFALNRNDSEKETAFLNSHKIKTDAKCVDIEYSVHRVKKDIRNVKILLAMDRNAAAILQEFYTDEYIFGEEYRAQIDQYLSSEEITSFLLAAPVLVNVTILPCPLGMVESNGSLPTCVCDQHLNEYIYDCIVQNGSSLLKRKGTIWIGTSPDNATIKFLAHRYCPFHYCNEKEMYVDIQSPESIDSQCALNHSGVLCGNCSSGLSLAIGSSRCIDCPDNNGVALLVVFIVAGVALVLFIKLLDLTVVHGTINGLIFYANMIWINQEVFFPYQNEQRNIFYNMLRVIIAWINLDFGIETCFIEGLDAHGKMWLQFVFPVYLWILAFLIIFTCHYSPKATQLFGNNAVAVLTTLFLLSFVKLVRVSVQVVTPVVLNQFHPRIPVWGWLLDANVTFFRYPHAFISVVACLVFLFLDLPYTLLLFVVGWLKNLPFACASCFLIKFKPLLDTYTGPLKDKYRFWVGLTLLVRLLFVHVVLFFQAAFPRLNMNFIVISSAILCILAIKAYKNSYVIALEVSFLLNLQILGFAFLSTDEIPQRIACICASVSVGFLTFLGVLFFHTFQLVSSIKRSSKCRAEKPTNNVETNNVETETVKTVKTTTFIDLREELLVEK